MILRYEKKEISQIWSDYNRFKIYLDVELAILKAQEGIQIPKGISGKIRKKSQINPKRIHEIEQLTKHDIIAFCTSITENLDPKVGKFFHFGVTSSDIIDTAQTIQIKESLKVILPTLKNTLKILLKRAQEMKGVLGIGRSHGMYAEPISFGQKFLGHFCEFYRRYVDLKNYFENELTAQLSGAVGNYTVLTPQLEKKAAQILGLEVEPVSTQVIPRDRIAKLIGINAMLGVAIERLAVEIRHLHRSEINELQEGFSKGQKGSSTMPHKKNPISGENLTGMARMLRSHTVVAMENCVLWHERDISHSSAERFYLPDNLGILFYSLDRLNTTLENLQFNTEIIENRVKENFIYLSSYYLHHLILNSNLSRDELYKIVQESAFEGIRRNSSEVFFESLKNKVGLNLPKPTFQEIKKIYLKHTEEVFKRTLKEYPI